MLLMRIHRKRLHTGKQFWVDAAKEEGFHRSFREDLYTDETTVNHERRNTNNQSYTT